MSLIFEEDLSGGDAGNFDTVVSTIGSISYAGGIASLTIPTDDSTGAIYLEEDTSITDSTPMLHIKFDMKVDDLTVGSTNRDIAFLALDDGTLHGVNFKLKDSLLDGEIDSIRIQYLTNAGSTTNNYLVSLADDTFSTFELFYRAGDVVKDSGRILLKIDDITIADITTSDQHASRKLVDKIRFGSFDSNASSNALVRILSFRNVEIASTAAFDAEPMTIYASPDGDDSNTGTEDSPIKNAGLLGYTLQPGDTLDMVGTVTNPMRLHSLEHGQLIQLNTATEANRITINPGYCVGTISSEDYKWTASTGVPGAYYLTNSDDTVIGFSQAPGMIAKCSTSQWLSTGITACSRTFGATALGSLSAGQYGYGDSDTLGFNAVYYYPEASETIETIHIEIPVHEIAIQPQGAYTTVNGGNIYWPTAAVDDNAAVDGVIVSNVNAQQCLVYGLRSNGGRGRFIMNTSEYNQSHAQGETGSEVGGGLAIIGGSTAKAYGNILRYNADDGMDIEGASTNPIIVGNVMDGNGTNSTDGCGIEVGSNVAGFFIANNKCANNNNRGISTSYTGVSYLYNNDCYGGNGNYDIWLNDNIGTNANLVASNNCIRSGYVRIGGTGTYTDANEVNTDPQRNSDYSLPADSSCVGVGIKIDKYDAIGVNGEPYPGFDVDIGPAQSSHSPFAPPNL